MIINKQKYRLSLVFWGAFKLVKLNIVQLVKGIFSKQKTSLPYPASLTSPYSSNFKGIPRLVGEAEKLKCVSCNLCVELCPSDCLHLVSNNSDNRSRKEQPQAFYLEVLRCTYCGLCEEVCPEDAIVMSSEFDLAGHAEQSWLFDHHVLAMDEQTS